MKFNYWRRRWKIHLSGIQTSKLPLKVKLFIWLVLEQKILTWEILVKRGIVGPSKCVLCGNNEENINHYFVDCDFSKEIWYNIQKQLKSGGMWEGGQISECFQNWIEKKDNIKELSSYICWEIWKQRNLAIFEDGYPNRIRVCNSIYQDLGDIKVSLAGKGRRIDRPPLIDWDMEVGFFYGVSQDRGTRCGAGAVIKCPVLGTYRLKMNCSNGTNTKGQILALWCILSLACYKKIDRLQLVGDSKIIIDRFTNENNFQVISLQPWMSRI